MRRAGFWIAAGLSVTAASAAFAITFSPATRPDPFAKGASCDTPELASYGSYVYEWPSKYDLVFSPQDYPMWVWRCEASGFVSFPEDFEKIGDAERARLAAYLKQVNFGPTLKKENGLSPAVLKHLEQVYALRDKDDGFRAYFLRYLAWQHRAAPEADGYRRKAMELHRKMLGSGTLKDGELLEALYVLGFYSYKFGDRDAAQRYFEQLKTTETTDPETKKARRGAPYLEALAKDVLEGKADDSVRFANAH